MQDSKGASPSGTGPSQAEPEVSALRASVPSAALMPIAREAAARMCDAKGYPTQASALRSGARDDLDSANKVQGALYGITVEREAVLRWLRLLSDAPPKADDTGQACARKIACDFIVECLERGDHHWDASGMSAGTAEAAQQAQGEDRSNT